MARQAQTFLTLTRMNTHTHIHTDTPQLHADTEEAKAKAKEKRLEKINSLRGIDMSGTGGKDFDEHHAELKERSKVKSKDVSAVSLGVNVSQHIRKTRAADEENDVAFIEEQRRKAAMLVKSAELKENMRTGPWTLVVSRRVAPSAPLFWKVIVLGWFAHF